MLRIETIIETIVFSIQSWKGQGMLLMFLPRFPDK